MPEPKRLIEVDLPIKRISAHSRREKSIRYGHIATMHIWWARRPLAACRAIVCASLWPDPADKNCPEQFIKDSQKQMQIWANEKLSNLSAESARNFIKYSKNKNLLNDRYELRVALLDFIADFSDWDNSKNADYIDTSSILTMSAYESLGGAKNGRPMIADSFAGGGSIPIEALRVGGETFASDLNPIPFILNKIQLEFIPLYKDKLANEVLYWGGVINNEIKDQLSKYYPKDENGNDPIAYFWCREITCEGPSCGAKVPLIKSLWLAKKGQNSLALDLIPTGKSVRFELIYNAKPKQVKQGTVKRGSATCPNCGYTISPNSVKKQLKLVKGGSNDSILIAVRYNDKRTGQRTFRLATRKDNKAFSDAVSYFEHLKISTEISEFIPIESTPKGGGSGAGRAFSQRNYGMDQFCDLFNTRQLLSLCLIAQKIKNIEKQVADKYKDKGFSEAVSITLSLALGRLADFNSSLCVLNSVGGRGVVHTFGRQAIPMVWDYMETNPFNEVGANWMAGVQAVYDTITHESILPNSGKMYYSSATSHPLPDDSVDAFITDPPYYDAVPYSDLSDFFFVWLKRAVPKSVFADFKSPLTPKDEECIVDEIKGKDKLFFESTMRMAMAEGRRITSPKGIGIIVFAHKTTAGWEAQLQAMLEAGWIITGSWPIDTERPGRLRSQNSAALASSVHLVCRPREDADGRVITNQVGDWRDILKELPERIHEWMPRLALEGVVGADAIFACLGPALEIFSRYSSVEKANGDIVKLKEYLEQVWSAVSQEALRMVFKDADTKAFEEDARLTAMWLWTVVAGRSNNGAIDEDDDEDEADEENISKVNLSGGFVLEYDTARKISQGLGTNLDELSSLVEINGDKARLLPVVERAKYLFGTEGLNQSPAKRKEESRPTLFDELISEDKGKFEIIEIKFDHSSKTVLDHVHQAMLLFAASRTDALKRYLIEDGIGKDERFWTLAQSLTALYPMDTDERRWIEAVQTYKKSLGF